MNETKTRSRKEIEDSIFIVGKHSLESLFMQKKILADITDIDEDICASVVETYNKVYDYMCDTSITEQQFAQTYQPKYFFEKNLDSFGYSDEKEEVRQKWDNSYYNKWDNAIKKVYKDDYEERINEFRLVREKVNKYTCDRARNKKNYMIELLKDKKLESLKKGNFNKLVTRLEKYVEETIH